VVAEVHRANMHKTDGPRRADGKQLKPEGWRPADVRAVLAGQTAAPGEQAEPTR
jgi:predicted HAD superfamily Cof-like phosphohydrolase